MSLSIVLDRIREGQIVTLRDRWAIRRAARRIDMRAVVIVEYWAMMAGALPYGSFERYDSREWVIVGAGEAWEVDACGKNSAELARACWAAEYRERPREVGQ